MSYIGIAAADLKSVIVRGKRGPWDATVSQESVETVSEDDHGVAEVSSVDGARGAADLTPFALVTI
jgi:hypothetical protein